MAYGNRLRELRAERRLSLRQVEERGGPNKDTMSLIERGVHRPHAQTLGRIAAAFGMSVAELRRELEATERPLAEAAPSPEQPPLNGFEDERLASWRAAVGNARQLRESGRARMEELLTAWRASKKRKEDASERRGHLDEMGTLLQQAYDAETGLLQALSGEFRIDWWPEVQEASRFYGELRYMVESSDLRITEGKQPEGQATESRSVTISERAA